MNRDSSSGSSNRAAAAQDLWLRHVARELAGEKVDFEALCAERADLAAELRELHARWDDQRPRARLDANAPAAAPSFDDFVRRLSTPAARAQRFRVDAEIARGGMGSVHRAWDGDLNRALALKVLRQVHYSGAGASSDAVLRFIEEAQVTAQLDHPGIVPVHEIGVDELGRPFFAMKLVEGSDLRHVFELAWKEEDGWNTTRVLGVLLKVCEALGYAHEKGVIHRDLKPSNVMVGRFGEVYVMDWGVARIVARDAGRSERVATVRSELAESDTDSAFLTSHGDVIGTAAYMSPEQARGDIDQLSPRSDVYALGAMLYELLTRQMPYASDAKTSAQVLEHARRGPPRPIAAFDVHVAPELVAVCSKAMERVAERRYANLLEVADDLRAYLEGRVVRAHRTGAWTATKKWVRRNRALATSLAGVLVVLALALLATQSSRVAHANLGELASLRLPGEVLVEYDDLWPPTPTARPALERWIARAESVVGNADSYRRHLEQLRSDQARWDQLGRSEREQQRAYERDHQRAVRLLNYFEPEHERLIATGECTTAWGDSIELIEGQIPNLHERIARAANVTRNSYRFDTPSEQLLHDRLAEIQPAIEELTGATPGEGKLDRARHAVDRLRSVELDQRAIDEAWQRARRSIADPRECPLYGGLEIEPQFGLLPIGRDPDSGLWEFAHLLSGEPAQRGADGKLEMRTETGIVLVLLPTKALYQHGSQSTDRLADNFDPFHQTNEGPIIAVTIDAFFCSKFEMTRAQWRRWTLPQPGSATPEEQNPDLAPLDPMANVDWFECTQVLREMGLELPTEAQWEYAARGGTQTPWWCGTSARWLVGVANLYDESLRDEQAYGVCDLDPEFRQDGFMYYAPVGLFLPNGFGLHDVHGNVAEWTCDIGQIHYVATRELGNGQRQPMFLDYGARAVRGGAYYSLPVDARCASRWIVGSHMHDGSIGLRPSRSIDR
jgi:formylglycine-generating enzyme required for sulfatase activity